MKYIILLFIALLLFPLLSLAQSTKEMGQAESNSSTGLLTFTYPDFAAKLV